MAAPCRKFARTVLLRGLNLLPCRLLWTGCRTNALQPPLSAGPWPYRPLHLSPGPVLSTTSAAKTDPQKMTRDQKEDKNAPADEEEEEDEGPEYIPKRKAKNPMMVIAYAWIIGLPSGVIGFVLAKREVDKNRLKQLRVRQRMKRSNEGEYEGGRTSRRAAPATPD